jgi:hypothetical protein
MRGPLNVNEIEAEFYGRKFGEKFIGSLLNGARKLGLNGGYFDNDY